ncbi:GntR family transcriptional regulator [Paeniglutamicibacter psychrophenolicus]|uniref:GntR family transcriptional regulator n=1 Tax=Paeniglutamicibacter psychrophenolicus TaxID=257454 RepID=UPI002781D2B2|nr:GntR family transcriptional regulator [Paeniglutamicibacter psychrophenolicus]MDQ0092227.1 GntR family transcriptional regulator [Paeniglutamicibacter psychrophenolicus]
MEAFTVKQDSPLTVWGQVQRDLRQRIEQGEFAPGARIPSESALVPHYGVSRMTVRRAIEALATDGLLFSRRGSGSFVTERSDLIRCEVNLLRPWREQLLATGHVARSRLISYSRNGEVPEELLAVIQHDDGDRLGFGVHVQEVNGVAIAITESWMPANGAAVLGRNARSAVISASSSIRICFADAGQAKLLGSYHDVQLLEIITQSRLRETGELVELARTSWVASRVKFSYGRTLTVGQLDMSELLPNR